MSLYAAQPRNTPSQHSHASVFSMHKYCALSVHKLFDYLYKFYLTSLYLGSCPTQVLKGGYAQNRISGAVGEEKDISDITWAFFMEHKRLILYMLF